MKQGFTLLEILVVLLLLPLILTLSIGVLNIFIGDVEEVDLQFDIFKLQYEYLMQTVANVEFQKNAVSYTFDGNEFNLIHDQNRFVKTPGYEILLYDVYDMSYYDGCLSLRHKDEWFCLEV